MSNPTRVGAPVREERTLAAIAQQVHAHPSLEGAILIGSLAAGKADAASDIDVIVCVRSGQFDRAWAHRHRLHVTGAIAYWDERRDPSREIGAHRWVTDDLVLVEALLATPDSGVRWRHLGRSSSGPTTSPIGSRTAPQSTEPSSTPPTSTRSTEPLMPFEPSCESTRQPRPASTGNEINRKRRRAKEPRSIHNA